MSKTRKSKEHELMLNMWLEEFIRPLAAESLRLVKSATKNKTPETSFKIYSAFAGFYLEQLIFTVLQSHLPQEEVGSKRLRELYELTQKDYSLVKHYIQEAVANAFKRAFMRHNNAETNIDYYCQIHPVPEPENKLPV